MSNAEIARKMKPGAFKSFKDRAEAMRLYFAIRRSGKRFKARLETTDKGYTRIYKVRA